MKKRHVDISVLFALLFPIYQEVAAVNEISRLEKDSIIEHALKLELPQTDTLFSSDAEKLSKEALKKVHECEYEKALGIIVSGLEKFPRNFTLQSYLAALLGDTSEITSEPLKSRMLLQSKVLFISLLKEVEGQPKKAYYDFKNEYYFRYGMYREQYELGTKGVTEFWGTNQWTEYGFKEYYCQGVGATHYAKQLLMQSEAEQAIVWAQKALIAWAQYFSYENTYYNSYVHYALALGILGHHEEMMRALKRSASLINRDLGYHEFQEVINFIEGIK